MELRERLNQEGNFSSREEKSEKWEGRRDVTAEKMGG